MGAKSNKNLWNQYPTKFNASLKFIEVKCEFEIIVASKRLDMVVRIKIATVKRDLSLLIDNNMDWLFSKQWKKDSEKENYQLLLGRQPNNLNSSIHVILEEVLA